MSLQENIKQWVVYDNEIKNLNNKIKNIKENKSLINDNIISYIKDNNLINANIKLSDSTIKFVDSKQTPALTYRYIKECLNECIDDNELVDNIINYMKEKREIKTNLEIKRTLNKEE